MKRRWKVGMALAGVGLAGFLVWAFRSDPWRGVAIQFLAYETNANKSFGHWASAKTNGIEARFSFTNGSPRAIASLASGNIPMAFVETMSNGVWTRWPIGFSGDNVSFETLILHPDRAVRFSVQVADLKQPMRVGISFSTNLTGNEDWFSTSNVRRPGTKITFTTIKDRIFGWFRRKQSFHYVSITIQDR